MLKILLHLSLLFASGIAAGEALVQIEDQQLTQLSGYSDQSDSKNIECDDDKEDAGRPDFAETSNLSHLRLPAELTLDLYQSTSKYFSIRAPPASL